MRKIDPVITGRGVISPNGIGIKEFGKSITNGKDAFEKPNFIKGKNVSKIPVALINNFNPEKFLGQKGLRNLDKNATILLSAASQAIENANLIITQDNTDKIGVTTGTTFAHIKPIEDFEREVFKEGIKFTNPALVPATVVNAASSQVSIRFNIQGFNTTLSTGFTSSLDALWYTLLMIGNRNADTVLCGAVDTISFPILYGFYTLGYLAGIKGLPISCPYDERRNGPLLGEASAVICVEDYKYAQKRGAKPIARIRSVSTYYDGSGPGKIRPDGKGLENAINMAIKTARIKPTQIDYISGCANSSYELDKVEIKVLSKIFGDKFKSIPISSIKSMIGETIAPAGMLQILSCIEAMEKGIIPPTINYEKEYKDYKIDCVPNKPRKKDVRYALVVSSGPGGNSAACVLEKI